MFFVSAAVVLVTILVTWVLASLAGLMREFLPGKQLSFYGIIVSSTFFFVPFIVIVGAYVTMFHIARAHARMRRFSSLKKVLVTNLLFQYVTELPKI